MLITDKTPEDYNSEVIPFNKELNNIKTLINDNVDDLIYIYLYNMLMLNSQQINILITTRKVTEFIKAAERIKNASN